MVRGATQAKRCETLVIDAFGQNRPQIMALAGYTTTFKKVIVGVPNEIGEARGRNGGYIVNSYTSILGKRFDEKYIKKQVPPVRLPLGCQKLLQERELPKSDMEVEGEDEKKDEPMPDAGGVPHPEAAGQSGPITNTTIGLPDRGSTSPGIKEKPSEEPSVTVGPG